MLGPTEITLLSGTCVFVGVGLLRSFRSYRSLLWGTAVLALITAVYPRPGNVLAPLIFGGTTGLPHLRPELFGIAWWLLGAWLIKGLLNVVLSLTIFPDDNQPHARRLFADLAAVLIYVVAVIGILDTVLKQPISTVLATSGVFAIVLGLALQNTLADVFSGLAINIERPFGAGDWITIPGEVEGQVIEINWRATRIKTLANDMIAVPNSVISKAAITNHRPLAEPHYCRIELKIDSSVPPAEVLQLLKEAAQPADGIAPGTPPIVHAAEFNDALIVYELLFAVDDFARTATVRSDVISRVAEALQRSNIQIGNRATDVRLWNTGATCARGRGDGG